MSGPATTNISITVAENTAATPIAIPTPTDATWSDTELTVTLDSLPVDGTVALADGTTVALNQTLTVDQLTHLTFTPIAGQFDRSSTLTYTVTDPDRVSASGTATLAIGPAVGDPLVQAASLTVERNAAPAPIGIQAPTDPNYDAVELSVTIGDLPADGVVALAGGAAVSSGQVLTVDELTGLTFTPGNNLSNQSSTFTYTVADPAGHVTAGAATLAISPVVVAAPAELSVAENAAATAIGIAAPVDPLYDSSQLTATITGLPTDGLVALADGTAVTAGQVISIDQLTGLTFAPSTGMFDRTSQLTYTVTDPGLNTNHGTAILSIGPAVGNPVTVDATLTAAENAAPQAIGIAAPVDPNYGAPQQLTVTLTELPANGAVTLVDGSAVSSGQILSVEQLTGLMFRPAPGMFDQVSNLGYVVSDPAGNAAPGVVRLAIGPAVGNPVVVQAGWTVGENTGATPIGIVAPTDPNYAAADLSVTITGVPDDGAVALANGTAVGSGQVLTVDQLTGLTFTPTAGLFDRSSQLTYRVTDPASNASEGTATLAIGRAVGDPVLLRAAIAVDENSGPSPINIALPNDPNYPASALTVLVTGLPDNGVVTLADGSMVEPGQSLSAEQLTGLTFIPQAGVFDRASSLTYTVTDPAGNASTGSAALSIGPALGQPVPQDVYLEVDENAAARPIGIAAPVDPNYPASALAVRVVQLPTDGTIALADGTAVADGQTLTVDELTSLTFTPTPGSFSTEAPFVYAVTDPAMNSSIGVAWLHIGPAIGAPLAEPVSVLAAENGAVSPIGIAAPVDPNYPDSALSVTVTSLPDNGVVALATGQAVAVNQILSVEELTGLTFTPAPGVFDHVSSLTYAVTDPAGNTGTGAAVLAIGHAMGDPVPVPAIIEVTGNTPTSLQLAAPTDPNYDVTQLQVTLEGLPASAIGQLTLANGTPAPSGVALSVEQLLGLRFVPAPDLFNSRANFAYTVVDPAGNAATSVVTIDIAPSPEAPSVDQPVLIVDENSGPTPVGIGVPFDSNSATPDLLVTALALPTDGTVTRADGTALISGQTLSVEDLTGLEFTPIAGAFDRHSSFSYSVTDTAGRTSIGEVGLSIGGAIGDPVVTPAGLAVAEYAAATPIGIELPTDPNFASSELTVTLGSMPTNGAVTLASGESVSSGQVLSAEALAGLRFTPGTGVFDASSSLTYLVTDPAGHSASGSAEVAIGFSRDVDPITGAALPVLTPHGAGAFKVTNVDDDRSGTSDGRDYVGPVANLARQFIWNGTQAIALKAETPDVFIKGGAAGDALEVVSGHNVLDGGGGSNFLVGGSGADGGADTFYVDARADAVTWSTIVHFHAGDQFTLWGFTDGTSTQNWADRSGAANYEGLTLHSETRGEGSGIHASVTFAGITKEVADAHFAMDTGDIGGTKYLHITYTA